MRIHQKLRSPELASKDRIEREKAQLRELREKEILEASEKLFIEKGFPKTTISDIANACELTNGAIYLYFKNKGEIILIIMTKISNSFADFLLETEKREGSGFERMSRLLHVYLKTFRDFHEYHVLDAQFNTLFDKEYPDSPHLEKYFAANSRVLHIFISVFASAIEDGSIKAPLFEGKRDPRRTAHMVLNVMNSYVEKLSLRKQLMEEEQGISMEEELKDLVDFLSESFRV